MLTPELRAQVANAVRSDTEAFFVSLGRRVEAWPDFRVGQLPARLEQPR
jgi:hypothetical protein